MLERPFAPGWDAVEIVVEGTSERAVHHVGGANHFLHLVEHVEALVLDPARPLWPAEDGVANVAACALVRAAAG